MSTAANKYYLLKIAVIIALVLLASESSFAQKRVYWIHGYNENGEFWQRYRQDLTDASHRGSIIEWVSSKSIPDNARDNVKTRITGPAILIGHSAGGLVARKTRDFTSNVKAVVTVGTPNQGAGIVSSVKSKKYQNVVDLSLSNVSTSLLLSTDAIVSIICPVGTTAIVNKICSYVSLGAHSIFGIVVPIANIWLDDYLDDIANSYSSKAAFQDMDPSSSFISDLNKNTPAIPVINIYSAEDTWPLIRMWGSGDHRDDVVSMTNTSDKEYDTDKVNLVKTGVTTAKFLEWGHGLVSVGLAALSFWYPQYAASSLNNATAAISWANTSRYLEYDAHNRYSELIGAVHYEVRTYTTGALWWKKTVTKTVPVYETHDGLIANKDSKMDATKGNVKNISLTGINHLEMSAHPKMRSLLKSILSADGTTYSTAFNPNR